MLFLWILPEKLKFSRKDAKMPRKTKVFVLENTKKLVNLCDLAALREVNTFFQGTLPLEISVNSVKTLRFSVFHRVR